MSTHEMKEYVIQVNEQDVPIGEIEKIEAHRQGIRHRAFSIFFSNDQKETLIQKRAHHKYHSGGLWANTCCGHPRPGESLQTATRRRLFEELGLVYEGPLKFLRTVQYKLPVGPLWEHELTHVFQGYCQDIPSSLNDQEVASVRWINLPDLYKEVSSQPNLFAPWLHFYLDKSILNF